MTCTEILVRLRQPPTMYEHYDLEPNYVRLRISPDIVLAFGLNVTSPVEESQSELSELLASRHPCAKEMDAYERVLGDAMAGDATLFAREDYVEEAWRIVDPALKAGTPVHEYEPKTWGPAEVESVTPPGGWSNPVVTFPSWKRKHSYRPHKRANLACFDLVEFSRMKIQVLANSDAVAKQAAKNHCGGSHRLPWLRATALSWRLAAATLRGRCCALWPMSPCRGRTCTWCRWTNGWRRRATRIAI